MIIMYATSAHMKNESDKRYRCLKWKCNNMNVQVYKRPLLNLDL